MRSLRVFTLAAALTAPAALSAQSTDRPVSLGVSGGLSLPVGDFGDSFNAGYNVTGHLFFKPASLEAIRLRADVSYDRWDREGSNSNSRVLGFVGSAVYDFPSANSSMVKPYVLGGLGIFNRKSSGFVGDIDYSGSDTNLGLQVGGGLTFQLSGFSTFAEAKLVNVFTEGRSSRYLPVTFGVRF